MSEHKGNNKLPDFETVEQLVDFLIRTTWANMTCLKSHVTYIFNGARFSCLSIMNNLLQAAQAQQTSTEALIRAWLTEKVNQAT